MEAGDTTLRRRTIDSGIERASNELNEDVGNDSSEDDVVFKDVASGNKKENNQGNEPKSGTGTALVVKERLLMTVNPLAFGGKYLGVALLIWLVGYCGFSFLWLMIGVVVFTWREHKRRRKQSTSEILGNIAKDEKKFFQTVKDMHKLSGRDLPSWVYFPDTEKAEWLNRVLEQLWPYACDYVQDTIYEKVEPSIRSSSPRLKNFKFTKLKLGEKSPRVGGVKVYSQGQTRRSEVVIDIQIIYHSDANIQVSIKGLSAGIKNLTIRGLLRVELRPLISTMPLAGAVSVAFVHQPDIDFDLTELGNFLDFPGIDFLLRSAVSDCVHGMMVLPERYVLKLADDVDISKLMYPLPKGVVRIHILEARDLEEKDKKILGLGGGSDPYVEIKVGRNQEFRSKTVEHSVNPVWNERFDAPVMDVHSSMIEITLYDDDGALSKADYLGSASIQVKEVYNEGVIDERIPLSNVKQGIIHVRVEWLELSSDPNHLTKAMEHAGKHDLNAAILNMYIDSAKDLPCKTYSAGIPVLSQVQGSADEKYEPSPFVKISLPDYREPFKTKVVPHTNNPVWEENFRALVRNPRMQSLIFKTHDSEGSEEVLGVAKVRISNLLEAPNMTMDEPFHLANSGPKSQLNMRLTARLLIPRMPSRGKDGRTSKGAFFVAKSEKLPKAEPTAKPDKAEGVSDIPPTVNENTPPASGESTEDDSGVPENPSMNDLGKDFASSPSRSSNGFKPSRSSSFTSEISSIAEGRELNKKTDKRGEYPLGRLHLTLSHSSHNSKLYINVGKAENLIVCDEDNNTSDPYVRMYLLPHKRGSQRRKTKVVKNSTSPDFNERIEYDVMKGDLRERVLDIAVKNKTGILSSEKVLMGKILIKLRDYNFEEPVSEWFPLQFPEGED